MNRFGSNGVKSVYDDMGGRDAGWMVSRHQDRFSSAIPGGVGLNLLKVGDPGYWEKRGFKLTADNRKSEKLAVSAMAPLYEKVTRSGGRLAALSARLLGSFPNMEAAAFTDVDIPCWLLPVRGIPFQEVRCRWPKPSRTHGP